MPNEKASVRDLLAVNSSESVSLDHGKRNGQIQRRTPVRRCAVWLALCCSSGILWPCKFIFWVQPARRLVPCICSKSISDDFCWNVDYIKGNGTNQLNAIAISLST